MRLHIPEAAGHEDALVMDRVAAYSDATCRVQQRDDPRRVIRRMDEHISAPIVLLIPG